MITKEECVEGIEVVINDKVTKWNTEMNTTQNGLVSFIFNLKGTLMGKEIEILPGVKINLLSKPKRFNENGNQVKFKIQGDNRVFAAWWTCLKHKVDIC